MKATDHWRMVIKRVCSFLPAIRFGRMPQAEKLKLKAAVMVQPTEQHVGNPQPAEQKNLSERICEAYLKNFSMNKSKARVILTGRSSTPVRS